MVGIGGITTLGIACGQEVVGENPPGVGMVGLELHGALERFDGLVAPAGLCIRQCPFEVRSHPFGVLPDQAIEILLGRAAIAAAALRAGEYEHSRRMAGHHPEDLLGLLGRERRLGLQHAGGMLYRDL